MSTTTAIDTELVGQDVIERLSTLPEDAVLAWFWLMEGQGAVHQQLLKVLSQVQIQRPASWSPPAIRAEHEAKVHQRIIGAMRVCFACRNTDRRVYFHHVIEVQNGGSNHRRNLVSLCFVCHQTLHPWLTEEPVGMSRGRGFQSLLEIARRTVVLRDNR